MNSNFTLVDLLSFCNDWEKKFLKSVMLNKYPLSIKQINKKADIIKKYKAEVLKKKNNNNKKNIKKKKFYDNFYNFTKIKPRKWQKKAFSNWVESGYKGTIKAVTGAGKTFIGTMALKLFYNLKKKKYYKTLIIVPTINLQKQWKDEIIKSGFEKKDIGFYGGGKKELNKKITIGIVNSIRKLGSRDLNKFNFLILDEIHRYSSSKNCQFLINGTFNKILGLSATPKGVQRLKHVALEFSPIVFVYSQEEAKKDGVLSKYNLINLSVNFDDSEQSKYLIIDNQIRDLMKTFDYNFQEIIKRAKYDGTAMKIMSLINKRKKMIHNSFIKIKRAVNYIKQNYENKNFKCIIFTEYIATAETIKNILNKNKISCISYHSDMKKEEQKKALIKFKKEHKVLISVKALDEGLNVPNADTAIIIAGNSTARQMIQRAGRVLRTHEGKLAKVIQIYIKYTKDEDWLNKRMIELKGCAEKVIWD